MPRRGRSSTPRMSGRMARAAQWDAWCTTPVSPCGRSAPACRKHSAPQSTRWPSISARPKMPGGSRSNGSTGIADTLRAWSLLGAARGGAARQAHIEQVNRELQARRALAVAEAEKAGLPTPAVDMREIGNAVFGVIMRAAQADHQEVA